MQPNPLHTAQIPQLIMKINRVSYSFEKTQKLEVSEGSGFHFLYLTLSVKGLKVDGGVTTNPLLLFHSSIASAHCCYAEAETDQR